MSLNTSAVEHSNESPLKDSAIIMTFEKTCPGGCHSDLEHDWEASICAGSCPECAYDRGTSCQECVKFLMSLMLGPNMREWMSLL